MVTIEQHKPGWLNILRWPARIFAMIFVIFFLFMFIGESMGSSSHNTPFHGRDYFILSLWFLTLTGLIIGLWHEGLGGLVSLASTLIQFVFLTVEGDNVPIFFFILIPSALYLISWYYHKQMLVSEVSS